MKVRSMSNGVISEIISSKHVREENSRKVLRILRDVQTVSRSSLAKRSNMSMATITRIVNELIEKGIVQDTGQEDTQRGRKPTLLAFNRLGRAAVGVRLDTTKTMIGVVDLDGNILCKSVIDTMPERGPEETLKRIRSSIESLLEKERVDQSKLLGIGVTLPGFVLQETGYVDVSVALGWKPGNLLKLLTEIFSGSTISIDGTYETLAKTECWFGRSELRQPGASVFFLFVGDGIGANLIVDSRLYRGNNGDLGEIGHLPSLYGGPLCRCGNRGCLEALVSKPAILARLKVLLDGLRIQQADGAKDEEQLLSLLLKGESTIPQLVTLGNDIARELAWGIVVGINCYDPTIVVVGGEVFSLGGSKLIERMRVHLDMWLVHEQRRQIPIYLTGLDESADIVGAASLVYVECIGGNGPFQRM